jgi:hypothetical protein
VTLAVLPVSPGPDALCWAPLHAQDDVRRPAAGSRYYDLPDQPLYYRNKAPLDVACCYSFNAYWTANAALHP